uniref:Caspase n=1 Tax=Plectus sambesii TaxID=2011161 RepID=A0A914V1V9_9BILA
MNGQVTGGTFVQGDYHTDSRDTHNTYNNQNNQGKMVGGPVYGGTVNCADTNNNSQNMKSTGHLNYVGGNQDVGGNVNQNVGASGGGSSQYARQDQSKDDQERQKAFDGFFEKYLSKSAIQKLPDRPYKIKTGKMLIINNEKWPNNPGCDRDGTNMDRDALEKLSKCIGFGEAVVKENLTVKQMKDDLDKFATEQDWDNLDAAIVCILSHGGENSSIYGTRNLDEKLELAELLQAFSQQTGNCKYLQGKPKIFIVQACRGGKNDNRDASDCGHAGNSDKMEFVSAENLFNSAYPFFVDALPSQESKADSNYKSQAADVLVLWATGWGFLAWRNARTGSYFIQELTEAIVKNRELHMIDLMERVTKSVKDRFQAGMNKAGECPQFLSSLDRKLYLM